MDGSGQPTALPYGHANFWMRWLRVSATKTFPLASTATPAGLLNWLSPLPKLPHVVRKVPLLLNFWMRWLPLSATKTFPLASTATHPAPWNSPFPLPVLPHVVRKGHGSAASHTHEQETPPEEQT